MAEEKRAAAGAVKHGGGLVGVGGRGSAHLRLLRTFAETVEVVAVCDLVPERAERGVKLSGGAGKPYTDFKQMLKHGGLETVFIATPNYVHTGQAVPALDGGFFTFVEKPMACTIGDCNAIIEAVRRNRKNRNKGICQVGLQMRHHRQ